MDKLTQAQFEAEAALHEVGRAVLDSAMHEKAVDAATRWAQDQDTQRERELGQYFTRFYMAVASLVSGRFEDVRQDVKSGRLSSVDAAAVYDKLAELGLKVRI